MKIALIPGHNSIKKGASFEDITEWDFNDQLLVGFYKYLPREHEFASFYRSSDIKGYSAQMEDLHDQLENWGCDLAIEMHLNDFYNPDVDGHEVLVMSSISAVYAEKLNAQFSKHLTNNDRGVKIISSSDNGYGFLSRGNYPCLITEPLFISHISDYLHGGTKRHNLIMAHIDFFKEI